MKPSVPRSGLALLCCAILAVVVYGNALHNPFVYDDYRLIVENPTIQAISDVRAIIIVDITRPLVALSYAVDTAIWGHDPLGYHVTSVLLHSVNVGLVFWVALVLADDQRHQRGEVVAAGSRLVAPTATALIFAVHPMMTQAVGYISGRSEVLYGCLFLMAFLAGRRWLLHGGVGAWAATMGLWVVSILAKETAVMLPVVLVAYDWFVHDTATADRRRRIVHLAVPMLLAAAAAGMFRLFLLLGFEYRGWAGDWRFSLVALDAFWRYFGLLLVPVNQSIFHALPMPGGVFDVRVVAGLLGLVALGWTVWRVRRGYGLIAFGLSWFALLMVPSSVLFAVGIGEALAEHRAYVASVGVFLAFGSGFAVLWRRLPDRGLWRAVVGAVALLLVARLGLQTMIRNTIWSDPVMLSREATQLAPDHWMPHLLLAEAYRHEGRCDSAIPEYAAAVRLAPGEEFGYTKLAGCLVEAHRFDEAERALLSLRRVNPKSQDASIGLGVVATLTNRIDEARRYFRESLARDPSSALMRQFTAFVDGTLPTAEHLRLCQDMHDAAQGTFDFEACTHRQGQP